MLLASTDRCLLRHRPEDYQSWSIQLGKEDNILSVIRVGDEVRKKKD